jgi:hypothetical protein
MANNLWTAFIADNGSNDILAASFPEGGTWTPSVPINQTSPFTPSLALFNGTLYVAFVTDDVDSATGVPSNRIFLCSTTDGVSWSQATFFNQYSKCAPSLAVWNGSLHIAFVANNPQDTLLVYYSSNPSDPASWSATVSTMQTSANAPSLAAYPSSGPDSKLYMAFVAENGSQDIFVCSLSINGAWAMGPSTGQTCHFSPSLAAGNNLYLFFAAQNGSKDLYICPLNSNGTWAAAVPVNQSTSATPCAAAFGTGLSVGFAANDPGGQVLIASTSNPSNWNSGDVYTQQQSATGPAIAVAPFPCCWQLVTYPGTLGGQSQYIFWGGLGSGNKPIPVADLVIEISIDEAIVVSPTLGTPPGSPIGFQINGFPTVPDQQQGDPTSGWSATAGDLAIGWQQFGVKMWPETTRLIAFAEYWPLAYLTNQSVANTFNLSCPNADCATLPSDLTIPAGWNIRFVFTYSQQSPGTITGFTCTVTDSNGASVASDMGINFLNPAPVTPGATPPAAVPLGSLAQLCAFQVVLVGFWSGAQAVLTNGGGTITVQSSTPLAVQTVWPPDCKNWNGNFGTVEDTNSTYGQLPQCSSKSFTQPFGIT